MALTCIIIAIGVEIISWPLASQFLPNACASVSLWNADWFKSYPLRRLKCYSKLVRHASFLLETGWRSKLERLERQAYASSNTNTLKTPTLTRTRLRSTETDVLITSPKTDWLWLRLVTILGCIPSVTEREWVCACHGSSVWPIG